MICAYPLRHTNMNLFQKVLKYDHNEIIIIIIIIIRRRRRRKACIQLDCLLPAINKSRGWQRRPNFSGSQERFENTETRLEILMPNTMKKAKKRKTVAAMRSDL